MNNQTTQADTRIIVVMGVSGCGKSTIAATIAELLSAHFKDGDELHPQANINKMEAGIPLTDSDREPWLYDVANYSRKQAAHHGVCVIACSALKRHYREILNEAESVIYVFLNGSFELISSRMQARTGHFMPETLLKSQFDALEDPSKEDNVVVVDISAKPQAIAASAVEALRLQGFLPKTESDARS
ncbi:MAG: gluconokinase [Granulosicoccus sp.]|jgi:gluconokinase